LRIHDLKQGSLASGRAESARTIRLSFGLRAKATIPRSISSASLPRRKKDWEADHTYSPDRDRLSIQPGCDGLNLVEPERRIGRAMVVGSSSGLFC
jgi:hypothetical protein